MSEFLKLKAPKSKRQFFILNESMNSVEYDQPTSDLVPNYLETN